MSKEFHSDYEDDTTKSPNTRTKRISSYKYRKCFFKFSFWNGALVPLLNDLLGLKLRSFDNAF